MISNFIYFTYLIKYDIIIIIADQVYYDSHNNIWSATLLSLSLPTRFILTATIISDRQLYLLHLFDNIWYYHYHYRPGLLWQWQCQKRCCCLQSGCEARGLFNLSNFSISNKWWLHWYQGTWTTWCLRWQWWNIVSKGCWAFGHLYGEYK